VISDCWGITSQGDPPERGRQQSGAFVQFAARTSELYVAAHTVYQYKNEQEAAKDFKRMLPSEFNSNSITSLTSWQPPPELVYASPVADQFLFACHESKVKQTRRICKALGQYANYVVLFHVHMFEECMTFKELEAVLISIDERIVEQLEIEQ
jgi:hypothetical protein